MSERLISYIVLLVNASLKLFSEVTLSYISGLRNFKCRRNCKTQRDGFFFFFLGLVDRRPVVGFVSVCVITSLNPHLPEGLQERIRGMRIGSKQKALYNSKRVLY